MNIKIILYESIFINVFELIFNEKLDINFHKLLLM